MCRGCRLCLCRRVGRRLLCCCRRVGRRRWRCCRRRWCLCWRRVCLVLCSRLSVCRILSRLGRLLILRLGRVLRGVLVVSRCLVIIMFVSCRRRVIRVRWLVCGRGLLRLRWRRRWGCRRRRRRGLVCMNRLLDVLLLVSRLVLLVMLLIRLGCPRCLLILCRSGLLGRRWWVRFWCRRFC